MENYIVYKLDKTEEGTTLNTVTKLTNTTPVIGNDGYDWMMVYAPFGGNAVLINFELQYFTDMNVQPIPALSMTPQVSQEFVETVVGTDNLETGWNLFAYKIDSGITAKILSSKNVTFKVSFTEINIDVLDDDYLGVYSTTSVDDETISSELNVFYNSISITAVDGNYSTVYKTNTSLNPTSFLFDGVDWTNQEEIINAESIRKTISKDEVFKGAVSSLATYTSDSPDAFNLLINQLAGQIASLYTSISALTSGLDEFMLISEYASQGFASKDVWTARNLRTSLGEDETTALEVRTHIDNKANPHEVTTTQLGLENVDNTSDVNKPVSTAQQTALDLKEDKSNKGVANGYPSLDSSAKVPASQLPSYVDDVVEVATYSALPTTGETGKIYVVLADETSGGNTSTYRWSGSVYVMISNTLSPAEVKELYEDNANTNAFTDALQTKLNGIETGAQVNVIETVKVNGVAESVSSKSVDIDVPTNTSDLVNDGDGTSQYARISDLAAAGQGDMTKVEYAKNGTTGVVDTSIQTVVIPLTYDTAGKFYATVSGLTLTANREVILLFPDTTTDLTETVSVSLDGGTTYKDLKYNDTLNHLLVKHTAELKCRAYYNGTDWYTDGASLIDYEQVITARTDSSIDVCKPISNGTAELLELQGRSLRQIAPLDIANYDISTNVTQDVDNVFYFNSGGGVDSFLQLSNIGLTVGNLVYVEAECTEYTSGSINFNNNGAYPVNGLGKFGYVFTITNDRILFDDNTGLVTDLKIKNIKYHPISNTPYANYTASQMSELNLPYYEGNKDVFNPSITSTTDTGATSTLTLNGTFRSVGLAYDRAYQSNGIWYKGENVKLITAVAIGATINNTLITDINLSSSFVATDEVTGDTQEGVYGDVLTLTNTATVKYQTATETPIEIDVDGSLICDEITTISQTQDLPAQITVSYPVTSKSQIKTNTENIIKTQNEVTKLEDTVNPLLTLDYVDVISVNKTIFAGERVTITPASGEISLLVPRLGTKVIPAGALMERQCFRVSVCGYLNSTANSSNTVKITINDGVTYEFINQSNTVPTTAGSNAFVKFEFEFSVFSIIDNVACISLNGNDIVHTGMAFASVSGRSFINECVNVDATEDLELDITYEIGSNGTFQVTGSKIILE